MPSVRRERVGQMGANHWPRSEERRVGSDWSSDVCSSDLESRDGKRRIKIGGLKRGITQNAFCEARESWPNGCKPLAHRRSYGLFTVFYYKHLSWRPHGDSNIETGKC